MKKLHLLFRLGGTAIFAIYFMLSRVAMPCRGRWCCYQLCSLMGWLDVSSTVLLRGIPFFMTTLLPNQLSPSLSLITAIQMPFLHHGCSFWSCRYTVYRIAVFWGLRIQFWVNKCDDFFRHISCVLISSILIEHKSSNGCFLVWALFTLLNTYILLLHLLKSQLLKW